MLPVRIESFVPRGFPHQKHWGPQVFPPPFHSLAVRCFRPRKLDALTSSGNEPTINSRWCTGVSLNQVKPGDRVHYRDAVHAVERVEYAGHEFGTIIFVR